MRMGARLTFTLDVEPALQPLPFPPMLVMTLVENAIRHGLEPAGGGHVMVRARLQRGQLEVEVIDDGVGFGGAPSSGTGVGLTNVRRQLAARHGAQAQLKLHAAIPRGACASLSMPVG
jgi:LytS/YehU family sensor histidine kinase